MSNIQFDEGQFRSNQSYQSPDEKGMVGWLIKKGIAKNARTANIILIIFAIICFGFTFYSMSNNLSNTSRDGGNQLNQGPGKLEDFSQQ